MRQGEDSAQHSAAQAPLHNPTRKSTAQASTKHANNSTVQCKCTTNAQQSISPQMHCTLQNNTNGQLKCAKLSATKQPIHAQHTTCFLTHHPKCNSHHHSGRASRIQCHPSLLLWNSSPTNTGCWCVIADCQNKMVETSAKVPAKIPPE